MNRKANVCVAIVVVVLACTLINAQVAAQTVTVTPANPTISVGETQQFTATGVGGATAVNLGAFYSCALLQDGSVRCWAPNEWRQLGDGTTTTSSTPVTAVGITGAAAVTAGGSHTCARFPDGTVPCRGRHATRQRGN